MKNKWLNFICVIATMIICQTIILLDLENLGNKSSGDGFIEYGFAIKFNIFVTLLIILVILLMIKYIIKKDIKVKFSILLAIITALISYNANIFVFENVINRFDFDGDGLSNVYEKLIGTNQFQKNNETRSFEIRDINIKNNLLIKDVKVNIIGKEEYLDVMVRDEKNNYYGDMNDYFQITIGNFGDSEPGKGSRFESIKIEIFLNSSYNVKNYIPSTYKSAKIKHPGIEDYYYDAGEVMPLSYEIDHNNNCYIVEIPYEFYLRKDLYRHNDDIYVGISPNTDY
jgi:hypothetical protein